MHILNLTYQIMPFIEMAIAELSDDIQCPFSLLQSDHLGNKFLLHYRLFKEKCDSYKELIKNNGLSKCVYFHPNYIGDTYDYQFMDSKYPFACIFMRHG